MQEKQLRILEVFKEMQKHGVFTILKSGISLDKIIYDATSYNDISSSIQDIKIYINDLEDEFVSNRSVSIGTTLAGFNDKFQYELHNMYLAPFNQKEVMYILETDYGKDNPFTIGLKGDDVRFTLEERKLLKLINHYYINLKTDDKLKDKMLYIPISDLKRLFPGTTNHKKIKDSIIIACERVNNKRVSWDLSKTRYATNKGTNLRELKLDVGKNVKLANITPVYSQYDKNCNIELKGIMCKVNKFLDLRFKLKQISYLFPTESLRGDYLSYSIMEIFIYHMNLRNNKKRGYVTKLVKDVASDIYCIENDLPTFTNYWSMIKSDAHKQRKLVGLLSAFSNVSYYLSTNKNYKSVGYFEINSISIRALTNNKEPRDGNTIYNELCIAVGKDRQQLTSIINFLRKYNGKQLKVRDLIISNGKYNAIFDVKQNEYADSYFNVDWEKLREVLVAEIKTKGDVLKAIRQGDIRFKVKTTQN